MHDRILFAYTVKQMPWFNDKKRRNMLRNEQTNLHVLRDKLDEIFCGLQSQLEIHNQLSDLSIRVKDPVIERQLRYIEVEIRDNIRLLTRSGVSLADLYKRFGATLFKSKLTEA